MTDETPDQRFERLSRDRIQHILPKRFYKSVSVTQGLEIALDQRIVKTPLKAPLKLPNRALAGAVAAEWEAQGEFINPHAMPFTKLANTAIDRATAERQSITQEILDFAGSDLVCYRATVPEGLVSLQNQLWNPVIAWAFQTLGASLVVAHEIVHRPQPQQAMQSFESHLNNLDTFSFTAAHNLTTLTGSAVLALMMVAGDISAELAWTAANVDEDWQIQTWGKDDEAVARRAGRHREFLACVDFVRLAISRT